MTFVIIFFMGRLVGLSWIARNKRRFATCLPCSSQVNPLLQPLLAIRLNRRQTSRSVGFFQIPQHCKIKQAPTKVEACFMGQVMGQGTNPPMPNLHKCVYTKQRLYLQLRSGVHKFYKISNIHFEKHYARFFKSDFMFVMDFFYKLQGFKGCA